MRLRTVMPESYVVSAKRLGMRVRRSSTRSHCGTGRPARSPIQPATKASFAKIHVFVSIDLEDERVLGPRDVDAVDVACAAMQSRERDRVERRIEIADNGPDLLEFEIDGQACQRRTPFLADQLGALFDSLAPALPTNGEFGQFRNSERQPNWRIYLRWDLMQVSRCACWDLMMRLASLLPHPACGERSLAKRAGEGAYHETLRHDDLRKQSLTSSLSPRKSGEREEAAILTPPPAPAPPPASAPDARLEGSSARPRRRARRPRRTPAGR
jgi:hypothetical protein